MAFVPYTDRSRKTGYQGVEVGEALAMSLYQYVGSRPLMYNDATGQPLFIIAIPFVVKAAVVAATAAAVIDDDEDIACDNDTAHPIG